MLEPDTTMDYQLIGSFIDELLSANSLVERFSIYERYILALGFDGATYTFLPPANLNSDLELSPVFAATEDYPVAFLDHYQQARFDQRDFTIRKGLSGFEGLLDWWEYERRQQISTEEMEVLLVAREDYAIRNGISVLSSDGCRGFAGTSIISTVSDAEFQRLKQEHLGTLHRIVKTFHAFTFSDRQLTAQFLMPFFESLSPKELDLLRHIAQGKPFKQVGYSIDVASSKVAANILSRIREKFGGVTRDRLMFLAGLYNLLNQS